MIVDTDNSIQDEVERQYQSHIHPIDWVNPRPQSKYNLVVIGAGPAGLVASSVAAQLGAKVALIEREFMGGDCLNFGCVPSKALVSYSRKLVNLATKTGSKSQVARRAEEFKDAMDRMRQIRSSLSAHDSTTRFRELGVDIFLGSGVFKDKSTIVVDGCELQFSKALIATGAQAIVPKIPGLEQLDYLTNKSVFSLRELPESLIVVGGGPIGCELSHAFASFGCKVTIVERSERLLNKEDHEASKIVQRSLEESGVQVYCNTTIHQARTHADRKVLQVLSLDRPDNPISLDAAEVLIAAGRIPNVSGLGLENAGIQLDSKSGIVVNDKLQTSNRRVFAAGDVCSLGGYTQVADFHARTVIKNALFWGNSRASRMIVPHCTFTTPEVATVGLTANSAKERGVPIDSYTIHLKELDRAVVAEETDGFVTIHCAKGSSQIVGATIVASQASEMISEIVVAMNFKIKLSKLANVIHPYPTLSESIRKLADRHNATRLNSSLRSFLRGWFRVTNKF